MSDTQSLMFYEYLIASKDNNVLATDSLFRDIVTLKPDGLFLLGDLVSLGFSESSWGRLDKHIKVVEKNKIEYYAIPGNHEYMLYSNTGMKNFKKRFKDCSLTGYSVIIDSIGIIMLNSNFDNLNAKEIQTQQEFYASTLDFHENKSSIKAIVVCCHHSPYTNSKTVSPDFEVQKYFLPNFKENKKTKLFLSGHSHNLECFRKNDKNFIVIGGGGGPKQMLYSENLNLIQNIEILNKPRFFYIYIKREDNELKVVARGIRKNAAKFYELEITRIKI